MKRSLIAFFAVLIVGGYSYAQEMEEQYNPNSIDPIAKYEHHFKKRVWRIIDLTEPQNKGFFAKNNELSKFLIEAVQSGALDENLYEAVGVLERKLSRTQFENSLQKTEALKPDPWDPDFDYYAGEYVEYQGSIYVSQSDGTLGIRPGEDDFYWAEDKSAGKAEYYTATEITKLELVEDMIFDKRRGRLYYDIQAINLVLDGQYSAQGVDIPLVQFRYKDLVKLFRSRPNDALWFNRQNSAEHRNFADAFLLRLFQGTLTKVENPEDRSIAEIYNKHELEKALGAEWMEMELMEKEHHLWEF